MQNIKIVETEEIAPKKRAAIIGLAGAGFIGNTALMYIVKAKRFTQVAYLHGNSLPPLMVLLDGKPTNSFRIYKDPSDELLFIVSEATISGKSAWEVGESILSWLNEKGISEIYTLEGFPYSQQSENLFGFTTGKKNLSRYNVKTINQGAITGVNAALLKYVDKDVLWTTLFIPTRVVTGIDYKAVRSLIHVLNGIFDLKVKTDRLDTMIQDT